MSLVGGHGYKTVNVKVWCNKRDAPRSHIIKSHIYFCVKHRTLVQRLAYGNGLLCQCTSSIPWKSLRYASYTLQSTQCDQYISSVFSQYLPPEIWKENKVINFFESVAWHLPYVSMAFVISARYFSAPGTFCISLIYVSFLQHKLSVLYIWIHTKPGLLRIYFTLSSNTNLTNCNFLPNHRCLKSSGLHTSWRKLTMVCSPIVVVSVQKGKLPTVDYFHFCWQ